MYFINQNQVINNNWEQVGNQYKNLQAIMDLSMLSRSILHGMRMQLIDKIYKHPSGVPGIEVLKKQLEDVRDAMFQLDEKEEREFDRRIEFAFKLIEREGLKQKLLDMEEEDDRKNESDLNTLENESPEC